MSSTSVYQHYISIGIYIGASIISCTIFFIECKKRSKIRKDPNLRGLNTTISNNALRFYSLFALFWCPMVSIITLTAEIVSIVSWMWLIYAISVVFWCFIQIFLTFYQMARLKYCFSRKNSLKYGYSNDLFQILTIYGITFTIFTMFINLVPKYRVRSAANNGYQCLPSNTKYYSLFVGIWCILF